MCGPRAPGCLHNLDHPAAHWDLQTSSRPHPHAPIPPWRLSLRGSTPGSFGPEAKPTTVAPLLSFCPTVEAGGGAQPSSARSHACTIRQSEQHP